MSHVTQLHNRRYLNDSLEIINRHGLPGNATVTFPHGFTQLLLEAMWTP